jgi:uncharacterized protein YkwD
VSFTSRVHQLRWLAGGLSAIALALILVLAVTPGASNSGHARASRVSPVAVDTVPPTVVSAVPATPSSSAAVAAPANLQGQVRAQAKLNAPHVAAPGPTSAQRRSSAPAAPAAPPAAGGSSTQSGWAGAVLSQLNSERAQNGLGPLSSSSKLISSAHTHNLKMAAANTMSHQLPGEAGLGQRISATGYSWHSCGENIGWTTNRSQGGAMSIETSMYNETPPNDGHRRNILSTAFTQVGIDVIVDSASGKLWITEDFGQP